jgi:hypothetical protein
VQGENQGQSATEEEEDSGRWVKSICDRGCVLANFRCNRIEEVWWQAEVVIVGLGYFVHFCMVTWDHWRRISLVRAGELLYIKYANTISKSGLAKPYIW